MTDTSEKIYKNLSALVAQVEQWKAQGEQVVFTNGCFDIVHLGHIDYLEKARQKGSKLIVGVNSDASVRSLKGSSRPIVGEYARTRMMAAFSFVDALIIFDEETPLHLIQHLKPDILTKGDDYQVENIVGAEFVMDNGGKVLTIPLVDGFSTSKIIEKIKNI